MGKMLETVQDTAQENMQETEQDIVQETMQDTEKGTIRGRTRTWLHKTKKQRCCRSRGAMGKNMSGTQNIHRSSTARGLTRRKPLSAIERGPEPMQESMQGNMQESAPDIVREPMLETVLETV